MKFWVVMWHVVPITAYVVTGNPNLAVGWLVFQSILALLFVIFAKQAAVSVKPID